MESLVSISLLTYNGEKYIKDCLDSIFNQTYQNIEVIVVDNASSDKTLEILKETRDQRPEIRTIFNKKNLGFAAGHNLGIKESRGEFILCLNQDVVLDKNFIKEAIEVFEKDSKIGAVQGKLFQRTANKEQRTIDTTGLIIFKNRRIINRGQGEKDVKQYNKEEEVFGADGATPIYRKEALEDVRLSLTPARLRYASAGAQNHNQIKDLDDFGEYFDQDFFAYKEDIDLSWRMRLYGWKIVYSPKIIAWHDRKSKIKNQKSKINILKSRRSQPKYVQYYSFKNQPLMQIKNELSWLFFKHLLWILPKEILSWGYVLFFEKQSWPAIRDLFRQIPGALEKRKVIMANKRVGLKEIEKWFI